MGILTANIIHRIEEQQRLGNLMKELNEQGITNYEFWDGVHDVRSTYAGINKAHKQIVKAAKNNNLDKVLIFENDIKFTDKGAFDYYISNEPEDYDIYLGSIFLGQIRNGIAERFTALTCYIVHSRFYDTFLSVPDDMHLDHALAGLGKYVVCEPFICTQYNGWSYNSQKHCNYDIIFENKKLYRNIA